MTGISFHTNLIRIWVLLLSVAAANAQQTGDSRSPHFHIKEDSIRTARMISLIHASRYQQDSSLIALADSLSAGVSPETYTTLHYRLGKFYIGQGKYQLADQHLQKALQLPVTQATAEMVKDAHLQRFKTDSARGRFKEAIGHLQQFKHFNDSIFSISTSRQIQELQLQYNIGKKDQDLRLKEKDLMLRRQDIELLIRDGQLQKIDLEQAALVRKQIESEAERKDQEIKMKSQNMADLNRHYQYQQSKLRQEEIIRYVTYAGGALLLVIAGLLYNRYRIKQKTNERLQVQQKEINAQHESLQKLVIEKEWLLKEIHHRVKNNLQIVMSLLNNQSAYLQNDDALTAIRNSQHRVQTISLIHKKLYQSDDMAVIDMPQYIQELATYLQEGYGTGGRIMFDVNVVQVKMDVSQAVPLGLILNEAITNSIKYAFPADRSGRISITLERMEDGQFMLQITDDGTGLPDDFRDKQFDSLGMSLMKGLTDDLGGTFHISSHSGTVITVVFENEYEQETVLPPLSSNGHV